MLAPLHLWRLASLDAPTVALAWAFSFAWAAGTHLSLQAAAVIALGVWTVYVGDRLLDARADQQSPAKHALRERHYFHWRHRRVLAPLAAVSGAAVVVLMLACIPLVAREWDSVLAAASLAYFARVHSRNLSPVRTTRPFSPSLVTKELLVGVLFAVGCALPALGADRLRRQFSSLAWLNCHAIERWESDAERSSDPALAGFAVGLAAFGAAVGTLLCRAYPRPALLLAATALSALLIALLDMLSARIRARLTPVTLRAAADLVLLAPAIAILAVRFVK